MSVNILFAATEQRWQQYETPLRTALKEAGISAKLSTNFPPETVDYIVYAPNSPVQDFSPFIRCKAVLNLWAGVEGITANPSLNIPLTRMVDPALTQGMVEWVTGHTLRHHLNIDYFLARQSGDWQPNVPPLASERPVTILGMGELGTACAKALSAMGFPVSGWSRSIKTIKNIEIFHGVDGLDRALSTAQILILLLPRTASTENILNARTLGKLPKGSVVINPGRGHLIDDQALLDALDCGQISHATLDVFRKEPLSKDHPFWAHPFVTVTPHIASETRVTSASKMIVNNIQRAEAGEPLLHLVDRQRGY